MPRAAFQVETGMSGRVFHGFSVSSPRDSRHISRAARLTAGMMLAAILGAAAPTAAQLRAVEVAQGFSAPVVIAADPVTGALLVAEQGGRIRALVNGQIQPTPFLDLSSVVLHNGEQGLLGLAFPPDARSSGRVYVNFVRRRNATDPVGDTVIARFTRLPGNPLVASLNSRKDLVWPGGQPFIAQPYGNHKGGNLAFGPDGYLYIGMGDGGSGNDPQNLAQNPGTLLGKMLRIDVNVPANDARGYRVPAGNPFVPYPQALPEIWAFGYRNPWRFSFDDFGFGSTGAMIVGDVGQSAREEINYEPAGRGGRNYGWSLREGLLQTPGISPPPPAYLPLTNPIADYPRTIGTAVTGGSVYRGSALPAVFRGRYFLADFGTGRVFSLGLALIAGGEAIVTDAAEHTQELGNPTFISTFGRGLDGELYFARFNGRIYRIATNVPGTPAAPVNLRASVSGSTVRLTWDPGAAVAPVVGYQVEAGVQPGQSTTIVAQTGATALTVGGVPPGAYFVKVRAGNATGLGDASNEIPVAVACPALPAPANYQAQVGPSFVSLTWGAVPGAAAYQIEAGSAPTQSDIAVFQVTGTEAAGPVAPRTYYTRVRALNGCGAGATSQAVVVVP